MHPAVAPADRVIAHRGASAAAPENTLAALDRAAAEGARWIEVDVQLTADGVPVLFHDDTLERTTDGRGRLVETSLAALKGLDAGAWFDPRFRGEPVPTLAEAMARLGALGLGANVEVKAVEGRQAETARRVAHTLLGGWPRHLPPPLLSSFSPPVLTVLQHAAPMLPRAVLIHRPTPDWPERLRRVGASALHCNRRIADRGLVRRAEELGVPVRCYTVDDPGRARRLFGMGVAAVFSNAPGYLIRALSGPLPRAM